MKKILSLVMIMALLLGLASISASAEENLCDKFLEVEYFHSKMVHTVTPSGPDLLENILDNRYVEANEKYPIDAVYSYASFLYYNNPSAYELKPATNPLNGEPYFPAHILVNESTLFSFLKKHFNVDDAYLSDIKNLNFKNLKFTKESGGVSVYDSNAGMYKIALVDEMEKSELLNLRRSMSHYLVGYKKSGDYYHIYFNSPTQIFDGNTSDKQAYKDYLHVESCLSVHSKNFSLGEEWVRYTVALDGNDIKYIAHVKVASPSGKIITPAGDVEYPIIDEPADKFETAPKEEPKENTITQNETVPQKETTNEEAPKEEIAEDESPEEENEPILEETEKEEDKSSLAPKEETKKNNTALIVILSVLGVLIIGGGVTAFVLYKKGILSKIFKK